MPNQREYDIETAIAPAFIPKESKAASDTGSSDRLQTRLEGWRDDDLSVGVR